MKINVAQIITGLNGEPIFSDSEEGSTLRAMLVVAINASEKASNDIEAYKLYKLGLKIQLSSDGQAELSAEEIVLLKARIQSIYNPPVIIGRLYDALEGEVQEPKED